jgi:hypothetical protein
MLVGRNVPMCSCAATLRVCVGVLCFYKLSSLVVIRLKQFSPSVNASLQNHWKHIIHQPICYSYFRGARGKGNCGACFLGGGWGGTSDGHEEVMFP